MSFQKNAFQNDAFQVPSTGAPDPPAPADSGGAIIVLSPDSDWLRRERQKYQDEILFIVQASE